MIDLKTEVWRYRIDWKIFEKSLLVWLGIFFAFVVIEFAFSAFSKKSANKTIPVEIAMQKTQDWLSIHKEIEQSSFWGMESQRNGEITPISLNEKLQNYRLKGVVFLDGAEAIIENAQTGKSSFVKEGESLEGLMIKHISLNEVIFSLNEQEGKLVLASHGT